MNDMYPETRGAKYDRNLSTAEIAKRLRADIKAAIAAGDLPAGTYSVRSRSFSGGSAIDPTVGPLAGIVALTVESVEALTLAPNVHFRGHYRTEELNEVLGTVGGLLKAYNRDASRSEVDYFDTNFYGHAEISNEWEAAERAVIIALCSPKRAKRARILRECMGVCNDIREAKGQRALAMWQDRMLPEEFRAILSAADVEVATTPEDWDSSRATREAILAAVPAEFEAQRLERLRASAPNAVASERSKRAAATKAARKAAVYRCSNCEAETNEIGTLCADDIVRCAKCLPAFEAAEARLDPHAEAMLSLVGEAA